MPAPSIFDNEASAVDLWVYDELKKRRWTLGDTLLYQPSYSLTPEEQADFPGSKTIKPDFVLQDLQNQTVAVIENKLDDPRKALPKLRLKYARVLKPRFLYACAKGKILFYDMAWRGVDAGEFRQVSGFQSLEDLKGAITQGRQRAREQTITIDTTIAGGYDPAAGKERTYQLDCIRTLLDRFREGTMKMLVHMATGLGKTRTMVALVKALLQYALARRVLFVVDRRFLARQAIQKGFSLISPTYNAAWVTTANFRLHKNKDIHVVVIDTLELLYDRIPDNPDPAHLIQRVVLQGGAVRVIDNIPIEKARQLFEEGVKAATDPVIAQLRQRAWEDKDYQPTDQELIAIREWVGRPDIYLSEDQLQRIYEFPAGSVWDFFLNVLGIRKIPTTAERLETGFDSYLTLYNFTPEQVDALRKIKDVFVANLSAGGKVDVDAIFANPIYARLIGEFEEVNGKFDGRLREVVADMQKAFLKAA